eukprot:TRINITY_DN56263_c0_g1_i1.p1 TRINITY_DN56263_c0_g1~~TRINITY_DN56263_c0_g1_i1.p1  ORF type:complete len:211 (+),score=39.96 TRINITY_DN56263_c0_g1_i1:89-634(+)
MQCLPCFEAVGLVESKASKARAVRDRIRTLSDELTQVEEQTEVLKDRIKAHKAAQKTASPTSVLLGCAAGICSASEAPSRPQVTSSVADAAAAPPDQRCSNADAPMEAKQNVSKDSELKAPFAYGLGMKIRQPTPFDLKEQENVVRERLHSAHEELRKHKEEHDKLPLSFAFKSDPSQALN